VLLTNTSQLALKVNQVNHLPADQQMKPRAHLINKGTATLKTALIAQKIKASLPFD